MSFWVLNAPLKSMHSNSTLLINDIGPNWVMWDIKKRI